MKAQLRTAMALAAAGVLSGCASGSGGGGGRGPVTDPAPVPARGSAQQSACGTVNGVPVQCVPTQRGAIDAAMGGGGGGGGGSAPNAGLFQYAPGERKAAPPPPTGYVRMDMYYEPNALGTIGRTHFLSEEWSARMGLPVPSDPAPTPGNPKHLNPFTQRPGNAGIDSSAYGLEFEYQSFGVWNRHIGFNGEIMAWSYGETTPASAVPASGNATFRGKLVGLYVSPTGTGSAARADVAVEANFSARTLGFSSTNTTLQDAPASHLDLRGTLTYAAGKNCFQGSLQSASGTLSGGSKGQFYGRVAEELGGAFTLRAPTGPETFAGAYGARR